MLKSEVISWPVTLTILLLAFGSLVAAGLPLMLTILGLVAAAGSLYLGAQIFDISIWAMNFALMFALALGIDYALFIVYRFRGALLRRRARRRSMRSPTTMDTAGKAVLFSGLTVLISLTAVMLVPSPAFRSMALGIMFAVFFVLAASLTLLPAVLAKLGPRVDGVEPALGALRRAPLARASPAGASGSGSGRCSTASRRCSLLIVLALPILQLDTGMPSIKVVPAGRSLAGRLRADPGLVRRGRTRRRCSSSARRPPSPTATATGGADAGVAAVQPAIESGDLAHGPGDPCRRSRPAPESAATIDRLRDRVPRRRARRRRRRREPRPRAAARRAHAARDRRRARARLPAAAGRAAGAPGRRDRRPHQPARRRRRVRRRHADLPGRQSLGPARIRVAGLPRCLGTGLLLRDDVRDLDGLHRLPALLGEGALGPQPTTRARRWSAASPTRAA